MGASFVHVSTRWMDPPPNGVGQDVPLVASGGTILATGESLITVSGDRQLVVRDDATLSIEGTGRTVDSPAAGMPVLTQMSLGGQEHVIVTGTGGAARGQEVNGAGGIGRWINLDVGPAPLAIAATGGSNGDLIAVSSLTSGGIEIYELRANGTTKRADTLEIGRDIGGEVRDLAFIDTGSGTVLLGVSQFSGELVSWRVDDRGRAQEGETLGAPEGLAISAGSTLRAFEMDGQDYVLLGAGGTSSLTLLSVGDDGSLTALDQINDTLETRFQNVLVLETIEVGGRLYVVAGGGDDGLSLFTFAPTSEGAPRFQKLAQIEDGNASALADPSALGLHDNGDGTLTAYVASEDSGISILEIDLGNPGQVLRAGPGGETLNGTGADDHVLGGAGNDRLSGGAGDDRIQDGAGTDRMTGGAGADTFVITPDGQQDVIEDFELGKDSLDFSLYTRLYSINDMSVVGRADGGVGLRFNGEVLVIRPDAGVIRPEDVTDALLSGLWHIDVNPFEDDPVFAVGGIEGDHLFGGLGSDTLFGSAGSDTIEGGGGADMLNGEILEAGYDNAAAQIVRLYQATLDRAPDRAGHEGWTDMLVAGQASLQGIADGFVGSAEFQAQYGGLSDSAFVTLLYSNVLGRAPDAAGLQGWLDFIDQGGSRAQVVTGFSESAEFVDLMEAATLPFTRAGQRADWSDDVYRLYQATLGREPDMGGFLGWTDQLARGADYETAVQGFINSQEFQARYGALDDTGFVELLYANVLGRTPGAAEVRGWTDLMESGMGRAAVVEGFAQSPEFQALTAPGLKAFMEGLGAEEDRIIAGEGTSVLFGGIGADTFVFDAFTEGDHEVAGFEAWDSVEITTGWGGPIKMADVDVRQVGDDTVVEAGDSRITFLDTEKDVVTGDAFLFV
ncbi:MAG: DUF4214 domain-containing protein [Pseudomonadota bacterium]